MIIKNNPLFTPIQLELPSNEELLKFTQENLISDYYHSLRTQQPIDYNLLTITAKNLKTISENCKRIAVSYFKKIDNESSEDSSSSSSNKNLVNNMIRNIP